MHARYSELEGRRALVTGGASGIGLAIATALAAQGVRVGVADIDVTAAQSAAGSLGSGAVAVQMDVSERASVERGFAEVLDRLGGCEICITLPMLRPVAAIAVVIQLINEFRTYDLPYVLTRGGPGNATEVLSYFAYRRAFLGLSLNQGVAVSWILLLIVLALTVIFFWLIERRDRQPA